MAYLWQVIWYSFCVNIAENLNIPAYYANLKSNFEEMIEKYRLSNKDRYESVGLVSGLQNQVL